MIVGICQLGGIVNAITNINQAEFTQFSCSSCQYMIICGRFSCSKLVMFHFYSKCVFCQVFDSVYSLSLFVSYTVSQIKSRENNSGVLMDVCMMDSLNNVFCYLHLC